LFRAAEWLRARRHDVAALEVFEAGKPWKEADADVCEAIDFCEYYGREAVRLDAGGPVESPPGERNTLRYQARGIGAVIAPWNFPLAIPTGMVVAALVTGNAVLFKPAEQTPAVAAKLVEALRAGGLPDGVLAFLPGNGEEIGSYLVEHPDVSFVAFTGSKAVGLGIVEAAAVHRRGQRHVKRVVAEMGGKNALIVDADADLDQAIPIVVASAFGYSGQKCSACARLIVVDAVHDQVVERLVGAAEQLRVGHPRHMGTEMGPLIDADAYKRVRSYVELAPSEGEVVLAPEDVPDEGYFVGPTIVLDVARDARLATEEVFGPVLTVTRAGSFEEAVAIANDTDYALTAGVVSRSPSHIRLATEELRAGNVYVNRGITGAVVGRQPFGGYGLSGVGSKAGGPDYLHQFVDPRAVSENTLRQGFAPSPDEPADRAR
jgi:RHH-type proline utilization regulon transcriptional repressor/proline dehydrogenase/delta 1-pyrroline-5-carboxylate dehydrogenase